ncbi:MAG: type I restriction endonuclease subunit R, partial [Prevotella sp.]|nr:type I restriction endonuclease subunit R [Prevotella sp.]
MKLSQFVWNLYKESDNGKKTIKSFDVELEIDVKKHLKLHNQVLYEQAKDIVDISETAYCYNVSEYEKPKSLKEARELFESVMYNGIYESGSHDIECHIGYGDYEMMLSINTSISYALYFFSPEYYFPNLFIYNFLTLNRIADYFEIELPEPPKKSDYKARCMYYMDLCRVFYDFRIENNLSPSELCAFLYDFASNLTKQKESKMPEPAQAWFIGGTLTADRKQQWKIDFWQANAETKKGDILVMYEISPVSAITSIWRAQIDGVIDPFFHYYSNTYITDEVQIPHISLKELKTNKYFSKHPLVRKNFQGVNGWQMSSEDYQELIRMIKEKGGKIPNLPQLYKPTIKKNLSLTCERDVERELLEPFLHELGISQDDYIRQLPIHAGRGNRIYPDYALFYNKTPGYEKAKVLIEAKYHMKNNREIEDAFKQSRSYANILESSVIILCDKDCLIIYVKEESFNRQQYLKRFW